MPLLPLTLLPCFLLGPGLYRLGAQPPAAPVRATVAARPHVDPECGQAGRPSAGPRPEHPFADRENRLLFAAVAASRGLDYSSTLNMRRRGRQEVLLTNDVVDNHAAFAA